MNDALCPPALTDAGLDDLSRRLADMPAQWVAGLPLGLDAQGVYGRFFKCEMRSRFVQRQVGRATLTCAELDAVGPDGEPFPPAKLFTLAAGADGLLKLDRLCRLIHALNHFIVQGMPAPLVLSIHPRLFNYVKTGHGRTFARMLAHFGLSPGGIVLALPANLPQPILDSYLGEGFAVHVTPAQLAEQSAQE